MGPRCERCKCETTRENFDDTFLGYTLCFECGTELDEVIENWLQDDELSNIIKDIIKKRYGMLEKLEDDPPDLSKMGISWV